MPTEQQIRDDVHFWLGDQDREHNLFFALGVEEPGLRAEAQRLYEAYEGARQRGSIDELLALSGPSQDLKQRLIEASRNRWIGWLFPIFYEHVKREIDYALTRMQRDLTAQEELCFWTQIGAEHAAMAAQLLDPTEHDAVLEGFRQAGNFTQLHDACQQQVMPAFVEMTRRAAAELDTYAKIAASGQVKSVIHPVLAQHIIREGQRFLQLLNSPGAQAVAADAPPGAMQQPTIQQLPMQQPPMQQLPMQQSSMQQLPVQPIVMGQIPASVAAQYRFTRR